MNLLLERPPAEYSYPEGRPLRNSDNFINSRLDSYNEELSVNLYGIDGRDPFYIIIGDKKIKRASPGLPKNFLGFLRSF